MGEESVSQQVLQNSIQARSGQKTSVCKNENRWFQTQNYVYFSLTVPIVIKRSYNTTGTASGPTVIFTGTTCKHLLFRSAMNSAVAESDNSDNFSDVDDWDLDEGAI